MAGRSAEQMRHYNLFKYRDLMNGALADLKLAYTYAADGACLDSVRAARRAAITLKHAARYREKAFEGEVCQTTK